MPIYERDSQGISGRSSAYYHYAYMHGSRRRKKTPKKFYVAGVLICVALAAILTFAVEKGSHLLETYDAIAQLQSDMASFQKLQQLQQLKKTYGGKVDRAGLKNLQTLYQENAKSGNLKRLKSQYRDRLSDMDMEQLKRSYGDYRQRK